MGIAYLDWEIYDMDEIGTPRYSLRKRIYCILGEEEWNMKGYSHRECRKAYDLLDNMW